MSGGQEASRLLGYGELEVVMTFAVILITEYNFNIVGRCLYFVSRINDSKNQRIKESKNQSMGF